MNTHKKIFYSTGEKKISGFNPAEGVIAVNKTAVILGYLDISPEIVQGNSPADNSRIENNTHIKTGSKI